MNLDSPEEIGRADNRSMLQTCLNFPNQLEDAVKLTENLVFPEEVRLKDRTVHFEKPSRIVVAGMGGSAISGETLRGWLIGRTGIPVEVCMDYRLPSYVEGEGCLVVAVSYSGNTEETLSSFVDALRRGCMVVSVSSGGLLMNFSKRLGTPHIEVPRGLLPRLAFPYLFIPLVRTLQALEVDVDVSIEDELQDAVKTLKDIKQTLIPESPVDSNPSKQLALKLDGFIPAIYGFRWMKPVAERMKGQFNENSKIPCFCNYFPSLNHNEMAGWINADSSKLFKLIMLRDPQEEPKEITNRIELTRELLEQRLGGVIELWSRGRTRLARILSLIYIGDVASIYLAFLRGVDPYSLPSVAWVKSQMAKRLDTPKRLEEVVDALANK